MKRVVSLDPEYLPWEGDVVRLRHKRSPFASILISLVLVVALAGYWGYRSYGGQRASKAGTAGVATPAPGDTLPAPGGESILMKVENIVENVQMIQIVPAIIFLIISGSVLLICGIRSYRRRTKC